MLRNIVEVCYEFHNQPFLLKYSSQLSQNDTANLRYVRASETTTSLYSRHPKKLLLTFRNENMVRNLLFLTSFKFTRSNFSPISFTTAKRSEWSFGLKMKPNRQLPQPPSQTNKKTKTRQPSKSFCVTTATENFTLTKHSRWVMIKIETEEVLNFLILPY